MYNILHTYPIPTLRQRPLWRRIILLRPFHLLVLPRRHAIVSPREAPLSIHHRLPPLPVLIIPRLAIEIPRRRPVLALPRLHLGNLVHGVHVLERQRLGLVHEEVHDGRSGEVAAEEDEAEGVADAVVGEGGEESDEEVAWGVLVPR